MQVAQEKVGRASGDDRPGLQVHGSYLDRPVGTCPKYLGTGLVRGPAHVGALVSSPLLVTQNGRQHGGSRRRTGMVAP